MGAKAPGCPNDRNPNEPNTRCGSFAGQPAKYSPPTGKSAETDGLKGHHGLSERQIAPTPLVRFGVARSQMAATITSIFLHVAQ
jgi:hypothetical protein